MNRQREDSYLQDQKRMVLIIKRFTVSFVININVICYHRKRRQELKDSAMR